MTEEIKVISIDKALTDINKLSEAEREIIFNTLAEENPAISRVHFEAFADGQTELIKYESRRQMPNIVELLLRKLVEISSYLSEHGGLILVPVVRDFKISHVMTKPPPTALGGEVIGGVVAKQVRALRQLKAVQKTQKELDPKAIRARFDRVVYAVTTRDTPYLIPPGEEVDVLGVKLYPLCKRLILDPHSTYKLRPMDILQLGNYLAKDLSLECELFGGVVTDPKYDNEQIHIIEANSPNVSMLSDLFAYLNGFDEYIISPTSLYYVYGRIRDAIAKKKFAQSGLTEILSVGSSPVYRDSEFMTTLPKSQLDFLSFIEGLASMKFSSKYALSVPSDLFSMGLADIFYSSVIYGRDSKRVLERIQQIKSRKSRI